MQSVLTIKSIIYIIGSNPFEIIEQNHQNHAEFMYRVFLLKDAKNMYDTYIWAYKAYSKKGFLFEYFSYELLFWKNSFESIENVSLTPIINLYDYLLSLHQYFIEQAECSQDLKLITIEHNVYNDFLNAILNFDLETSLQISKEFIQEDQDIKVFWQQVILPALYTVGTKWENGEISVGEEHTATFICQRVMSEHYSKVIKHITSKSYILVTTSPHELHNIGASILSDILELNGYNVILLSSSSTQENILNKIDEKDIKLVIISTALVSNLSNTEALVKAIKTKPTKVIVGGQAYMNNSSACSITLADYCLTDINALLELLKKEV